MIDPTPTPMSRVGADGSTSMRSPGRGAWLPYLAALTAAPLMIATAGLFPATAQASIAAATGNPLAGASSPCGCRRASAAMGPDNPQHKPSRRHTARSPVDAGRSACRTVASAGPRS